MAYATISGTLKDLDGTTWKRATWTAVPVSPSSKPVFSDGTPVPTTSGVAGEDGNLTGLIPQTTSIIPPGTTLTITISPLTSSAPITITKVQIIGTTVDLAALLAPRIPGPRIQAGAIVYAYNSTEIINAKHGNGYVNTTDNQSYIYMTNSWEHVSAGQTPTFESVTTTGNITAGGNVFARGAARIGAPIPGSALQVSTNAGNTYLDSYAADTATKGAFVFRGLNSDASANSTQMTIDAAGAVTIAHGCSAAAVRGTSFEGFPFPSNSSVLSLDSDYASPVVATYRSDAGLGFKFTQWGDGVHGWFFDSSNQPTIDHIHFRNDIARVDFRGGIYAAGAISCTGAKPFVIPYPDGENENKFLIHCCLEGPENGIYYRGESETIDGVATITLPDYFELIARPEGRSVLLTQIDEDGTADLAILAASRVVDGSFAVRSSTPSAKFAWQVNGTRADLTPLEAVVEAVDPGYAIDLATRKVNQQGTDTHCSPQELSENKETGRHERKARKSHSE
jgi:hypothetical protein